MFSRILSSALAAAAVVTATPSLANEPAQDVDAQKLPPCCERVAMHMREQHGRTEATEKQNATSERIEKKTAPRAEEDPNVRNQSWGG